MYLERIGDRQAALALKQIVEDVPDLQYDLEKLVKENQSKVYNVCLSILQNPADAEDISQEVFDLYDDYAHNRIDRRLFMDRLSTYAVGGITLPALMSFVMPNYQDNIQVKADDPRLITGSIS